ncbi:VapC toxin family PIN domain ribonuclease, partial [Mycobacterium tuberculosis]|uniref:VapC toxin family PIN domain ribonuclease n=1 Tax=Mycobacterium tuberculosis TaxID=1773 RepID=UPI0030100BAD
HPLRDPCRALVAALAAARLAAPPPAAVLPAFVPVRARRRARRAAAALGRVPLAPCSRRSSPSLAAPSPRGLPLFAPPPGLAACAAVLAAVAARAGAP